jgi:hypothetical protein
MAKDHLDDLDRHAAGQQQGACAVPRVMEADHWEAARSEVSLERRGHGARPEGRAFGPAEDQVVLGVVRTEVGTLTNLRLGPGKLVVPALKRAWDVGRAAGGLTVLCSCLRWWRCATMSSPAGRVPGDGCVWTASCGSLTAHNSRGAEPGAWVWLVCQGYIRRYRDWRIENRPKAAKPSATAVSRNLPNGCARIVCSAPSSPCAFFRSKVSVA